METFLELFDLLFFRNALLAALLASVSCGIIGTSIVSRRMVFISGGITHASFGGIGIGYFFGFSPIVGAIFFGVLSALGIEYMSKKTEVREDSVIAILWSLGMATGIIFVFLTPGYSANLMSYLFGNILTVSQLNLRLLLALSLLVIVVFSLFFKTILFVAFDENFARAIRLPVDAINYLLITLVALTIVLNIRVAGIILVLSLLTIPQTIANLFTHNFKTMIFLSILTGMIGSFAGLLLSWFFDIPSGATIIFFLVLIYLLARIVLQIRISLKIKRQINTEHETPKTIL
ncbi:MAG: metal ABC transporter permease [Clostridia bacterium]|nr:metal ABC transporter permease [Clostridia bacterium]